MARTQQLLPQLHPRQSLLLQNLLDRGVSSLNSCDPGKRVTSGLSKRLVDSNSYAHFLETFFPASDICSTKLTFMWQGGLPKASRDVKDPVSKGSSLSFKDTS